MNERWTPGPWHLRTARPISVVGNPDVYHIDAGMEGKRTWVAEARDINAHLIASAPTLYAALVEVRDVICGAGLVEEFPVWVIDAIDAALAKARGEAPVEDGGAQ